MEATFDLQVISADVSEMPCTVGHGSRQEASGQPGGDTLDHSEPPSRLSISC